MLDENRIDDLTLFYQLLSRVHHGLKELCTSFAAYIKVCWLNITFIMLTVILRWVFILPVILYGAETWSPTQQLMRNLNAFDRWCLHRILCIPWWAIISNEEVRRCTNQPPLMRIVCISRLMFFGHTAHADRSMDHSRAMRFSLAPLPRDWNQPSGRLRHTWLQAVKSNLAPFNNGLAATYHQAQNRCAWSIRVEMATSASGQAMRWRWRWWCNT